MLREEPQGIAGLAIRTKRPVSHTSSAARHTMDAGPPLLMLESLDDEIPEEFKCPISGNVMSQPAIWNGHTYEWEELRDWVHHNDSPSVRDPTTGRMVDLHLIETEEGGPRCYTFPPNSVQPNMAQIEPKSK